MKQNNFSIGVIGVGHLGEYHVKHLKTIKSQSLLEFLTLIVKEHL